MEVLTYLLRDIDPRLWLRFRERAASERIPMRTLLLHFVRLYTDGGIAVFAVAPGVEATTTARATRAAARPVTRGRRPKGRGGKAR